MKDYSNISPQSPGSISSLSLGSTSDASIDMLLQLEDRLVRIGYSSYLGKYSLHY